MHCKFLLPESYQQRLWISCEFESLVTCFVFTPKIHTNTSLLSPSQHGLLEASANARQKSVTPLNVNYISFINTSRDSISSTRNSHLLRGGEPGSRSSQNLIPPSIVLLNDHNHYPIIPPCLTESSNGPFPVATKSNRLSPKSGPQISTALQTRHQLSSARNVQRRRTKHNH
jgi:hypothetical protein